MNRERAIAELKERLQEYLESRGINTGKNFRCLNPQHEDKNPSMGFDKAHNQVHCFSCNKTYDIIDLIQQEHNCDFNAALKIGCEMYHIQLDKEPRPNAGQAKSSPIKGNSAKAAQPRQNGEQERAAFGRLKAEFDAAQPATNEHLYLQRKQVRTDKTLKINQVGELLIDLYDVDGNFRGYQRISADGLKKQAYGTKQDSVFHIIGGGALQPSDTVILAEGYATAFSVYEGLYGHIQVRIVFALNCDNLLHVAQAIKAKLNIKPFIAADKDTSGLDAAIKCCEAGVCSGYFTPPLSQAELEKGLNDWNDYYCAQSTEQSPEQRLERTRAALIKGFNNPICPPVKNEVQDTDTKAAALDINDYYIEFGARKDVKPIDMIGGLFPRGKLSAIIAPPGTGKTWFILYLAMYFSRGGSGETGGLLSKFPIERPYKSIILSGEGGYDELFGRSKCTEWSYNSKYFGVFDLNELIEKDISLSLTQEDGRRNLESLINRQKPDIIFLDSLMAFSDYDENKSQEMSKLMKYLMQVARSKNIAVVPVHHTRKRRLNERKAAQIMDEMIGSSMMQRYTRRIIGLQPKGQMILEEVTGDEPVIVRDLKNNLTKKFTPFTFCIAKDEDTNKLDMEFEFEPDLTFKAVDKKGEILHYIEEHYEEGDDFFTRADLEKVFTAKSTLKLALKELVEAGRLGRCGNGKNAQYFLRPEIVD